MVVLTNSLMSPFHSPCSFLDPHFWSCTWYNSKSNPISSANFFRRSMQNPEQQCCSPSKFCKCRKLSNTLSVTCHKRRPHPSTTEARLQIHLSVIPTKRPSKNTSWSPFIIRNGLYRITGVIQSVHLGPIYYRARNIRSIGKIGHSRHKTRMVVHRWASVIKK